MIRALHSAVTALLPATLRHRAKMAAKAFTRSYDGAGGGRRWKGSGEMPLQLAAMGAARGPIAKRSRYLVGSNALAASAVEAWVSALVGTQIKPQSAHPDAAVREQLNAAWEIWTDRADAEGLTDAYGLQALAARRMVTDGDAFAVLLSDSRGELRIRIMDAEQIDPTLHRELPGGARIVAGVEFDAAGRRVAYHALRERPGLPLAVATPLDTVRLPAEDVCHLLNPAAPGQVRGLSWFAPVLLRLHDLDQLHDAQIMRQKVAALLAGFIVDPNAAAGGFTGETKGNVLDGGLEPGTLKILDPGQDIRFSDPATIGAEAIDFLKLTAREIAAGIGIPYETLTGDLSGVNYSSIRTGLVEFRRRVEVLQNNVIVFQLCRPIWRRFVTLEILSGRLPAPGFERNPELYLSARWITPRFDWVDPLKDVNAEIAAINAGLMSRRQAVARRGYDLEQLDREIADDNDRARRLNLAFGSSQPNTAPAEEGMPT